jgi:NitT/TauT family transport system permease protein
LHKSVQDRRRSRLTNLVIFAAGLALVYGVVAIGRTWLGPHQAVVEISHRPTALPGYAARSLIRIGAAYIASLLFALAYGYAAARSVRAERWLIPLLDILQSIPVLSFLPGVMLAMIALFPHRQIGLELGVILLIFTGQVWNIAFSFYSSLKSIPRELREAGSLYGFNPWQNVWQLELPSATIGLVWNSMMSVAGGWFFLMACEMFQLGDRDFRLPGLGSYLQTASNAGDTHAILWGLAMMVSLIIVLDRLVWRPLTAWAERFKFEQVESANVPSSAVLDFLRRSDVFAKIRGKIFAPLTERIDLFFARKARAAIQNSAPSPWKVWVGRAAAAVVLAAVAYGATRAAMLLAGLTSADVKMLLRGALATFLRVNVTLLLAAAWTIPVGVAIGSNPRLAQIAQPAAQVAASVPATALFPVILLLLIRAGGGMGLASLLLMLLGTQWYVLFNVIAGATAIPSDLKEAAGLFGFGAYQRWRLLILPALFPYLVTGMVTAAGGAWNASIVAEYFQFKGRTLSTIGLGSIISEATEKANFDLLLAATIILALMVVTFNRLVWRRLYRLAATRFKLES